jgi:hypothetical protein
VAARVYEPDWTTDERVAYTCAVADLLADLAPDHGLLRRHLGVVFGIGHQAVGFEDDVVEYVSREIEFVERELTRRPTRGSDLQ